MNTFHYPLLELNEYQGIKENIEKRQFPVQVTGCIDSQKCHLIDSLGQGFTYRIIVTYNELKAKEIYEDYRLYDREVYLYPAKDIIFYSADIHGNAIVRDRLRIIKRLLEKKPATIILSLDGGMEKLLPLEYLQKRVIEINQTSIINLKELSNELVNLGYERQAQVEAPGDFAVRGGIIDVFPLTEECPYRIELWGDEIDSIRSFDVSSQRSIEQVERILIYPAMEIILDESHINVGLKKIEKEEKEYEASLREAGKLEEAGRIKKLVAEFRENLVELVGTIALESYIKFFYEDVTSFFQYFSNEDSIFFIDEVSRLEEKGQAVETEFREGMIGRIEKGYILPSQMDVVYGYKELFSMLTKKNSVLLSTLETRNSILNGKVHFGLTVQSVPSYNKNFELLVSDLKKWKKNKYRVIVLCGSRTRAQRITEGLHDYDITAFYSEDMMRELMPGEIMIAYGNLKRGFEYPFIKFVMISESDIFGVTKKPRRKKTTYEGNKIHSFADLNIGDYVVHENHGLGIYRGIEKIEVDKVVKDYVKIEYGGGGNLYVLATELDLIQKYAGSEARKPKLNKLNSIEWRNTKSKVKGAVREVAKDLVELYAKRQEKQGFSFGPDTVWQKEFEELFPYEETQDQLNAIEQTKADMESTRIMDRLICGDVGYGKTEVAIRAAFKACCEGKQVVILVPTTILAQQHYNTLSQRIKDFPVRVDMLSRFRTPAEQKKTLEGLKNGSVDIVVGTHRVLSKDIKFKNLGLLIVDEEQRFGVRHKEKIKQLKNDIDVLTLTATPIPRTLHMSLVGIRDMSVLDEPPVDRLPIQTFVLEQNEEIVREAIMRELSRGGQVYYVFNRVNGIEDISANIQKLVPDANVQYAHGQMSERMLEKIMYEFISGEIDVLVSTTIIETGLDIANVNTMIIADADRMGLSQLYQLRGRVGRSNRTSYAFLMYQRNKMLREIAEKRLSAIKEFTELGSGFKIAMRDLEIRGAGNLLGEEQSGHMASVGYDLYCKMLNEAVKVMKGEISEDETFDTTVEVDVDAYIPSAYIKNELQKLDVYKRIADIENQNELMDMQEELIDRFGEMPNAVNNLLHIALLKGLCHKIYVTELSQKDFTVKLVLYPKAKLEVSKLPQLIEKYQRALKLVTESTPYFIYQLPKQMKLSKTDIVPLYDELCKLITDISDLIMES